MEHPVTAATVEGTLSSNHLKGKSLDHLKFRLRDLELATNKFSEKYYIGSGGYGKLHHANKQGSTLITNNIAGTEVYLDPEYLSTVSSSKLSMVSVHKA
ncbi:hypothetical protein L1987_61333 [Smallanthus sonchifolius]|uniref:Uncharacterized protein n=1 Tax=Smallanthus sonchifolius TaxID=185202 RepID=A0ACB9DAX5_9ASTR|nr:hypothetical protein L1987_61333 [Smallanthus sonchifolius]